LTKISDLADKEQTNKEEKMLIQSEIFNIINLLAKELNLGGEISKEMLVKLNKLENSIVPYLNIKTYKPLFISALNDKINNGELPFKKAEIAYWVDGEYVFIEIEETPICVIAGPILKSDPGLSTIIGLYIDYYKFPEYWDYRDASRGWRKDMLKGFWTNPINFVDFSNVESLNNFIEKFHSSNEQENPIDILFSKIEEFYKQWTFEGKSVQDITEICIKNKS